MSSAAEILVIILSIFLAFFLLLSVILVIYLINLTRQIRRVTDSAEKTIGDVSSVISKITTLISPVFIADMISKFIKKSKKTESRGDN